ncbi:MAG: glycolate oxidase subunit GlcE [Moraxellaceae bacterium]|nr:glycolate oxidase subunit GlcE [Moraxellaceae bacterium]
MAPLPETLPRRWCEQVREAAANGRALRIVGGGSKSFLGDVLQGDLLDTRGHSGVVDYDPAELVISVRAGTPLHDVTDLLDAHGQMLAFEPPAFAGATIGGMVASGLSGPRRVQAGAVRDHLLGVSLIDGQGQLLRFGGRVMKNVAGFDVSRLMAGAWGTLGLITEVSLRTLPRPPQELTLRLELDEAGAIDRFNRLAGQPLPLSATAWHAGLAHLRLSGTEASLRAARATTGGEPVGDVEASAYWQALRDQRLPFFTYGQHALWRLSVPGTTAPVELPGEMLMEWHGGLRWLRSEIPATAVRTAVADRGGHAQCWYNRAPGVAGFEPLQGPMAALHRRLRRAFDPQGVFNPGRMGGEF